MGKRVKITNELENENKALKQSINEYRGSVERFNDDPSGSNFRWKNTCYDIMCGIAFEPSDEVTEYVKQYPELGE